jgi:hypothetical protein
MTGRFKTQVEEDAERLERARMTHERAVKWAEARLAGATERARASHETEQARAAQPEEPKP